MIPQLLPSGWEKGAPRGTSSSNPSCLKLLLKPSIPDPAQFALGQSTCGMKMLKFK